MLAEQLSAAVSSCQQLSAADINVSYIMFIFPLVMVVNIQWIFS